MELSGLVIALSIIIVVASILLIIVKILFPGEKGMGLERLYPFVLLIFGLFLFLALMMKSISEDTFSTLIAVIFGAFVTNFNEVIKIIKEKRK